MSAERCDEVAHHDEEVRAARAVAVEHEGANGIALLSGSASNDCLNVLAALTGGKVEGVDQVVDFQDVVERAAEVCDRL